MYKLQTPVARLHHERGKDCWILHLAHSADFMYGTRLVLYDSGRRELQVERPNEVEVVDLDQP